MNNRFFLKVLSLVVSLSLYICAFSGCSNVQKQEIQVDKDKIVLETVQQILEELDEDSTEDNLEATNNNMISADWQDYVGDIETFVYGLISNELNVNYDVFPACTELQNGVCIDGIGFTDYSECYSNNDESKLVFSAGFIPYCGEISIPEDEYESGLELVNTDYQDDTTSFVITQSCNPFVEHCVVYGDYVQYGVNESGQIFYSSEEYNRSIVDESVGSLYSYDELKYLLDTDFGDYNRISGTSLSKIIDYSLLEKEINQILKEQDYNFSTVNIEESAYFAREAIESYFASLQEEVFLGFSVKELEKYAKELDPKECYRITDAGLQIVNPDDVNSASTFVKWLVGTSCVIVTAVALVGAVVFIECPPLSAAAGAMAGVGIEVFMQVVISGQSLDSVQWSRVAMAAATGAVSGFLGPYMMAQFSGATYFLADSVLDGVLGGIEKSAAAWLDGSEGQEIIKEFGYGLALGFALSSGFKAAGKVAETIAPKISKIGNKLLPNVTKKTDDLTKAVGSKIYKFKEVADASRFHSEYISNKLAWRELERIIDNGSDELANKSFNALSKRHQLTDLDDNPLTKQQLREIFDKAKDNTVIAKINIDDEIVSVVKQNGVVGIYFDPTKYQTVILPKRLVADRNENFAEAAKIYKKQWMEDENLIPDSVKRILNEQNLELEDLMPNDLVAIIQKSDMVFHENIDMQTITLVARKVHDKALGGISHFGGYGIAEHIKEHMGYQYFERFIAAASSAFSQGR